MILTGSTAIAKCKKTQQMNKKKDVFYRRILSREFPLSSTTRMFKLLP